MIAKSHDTTLTIVSDREIEITRTFDAPRHLVFEVLTQPEHVRQWWGLRDHEMIVCEIDLRVGGKWRYVLRAPDGSEHGFSGEYREIVPPERLVATEGYEALPPGHDYLATLTLTEQDGRTLLVNRITYRSVEDRDGHLNSGMEAGMRETYDRLAELLASKQADSRAEITLVREFDAPVEAVWRAWTEPEQVMRWWGPVGFTSPTAEIDLRVGGKYLFCMRSPEGQDFYSTGTFLKIEPFKELVYTDSFADAEGNVVDPAVYGMEGFPQPSQVTVRLEDLGGRTRMTLTHSGLPAGEHGEMAAAGWQTSLDKMAASLR